MRLYLVQHGEAYPKDVDPQRQLTEKGRSDVAKVAQFLRPLKLSVAAIWHSGKLRARQTADILADSVTIQKGVVERQDLAPKDPVMPVRREIEQRGQDLMIVGHLPFLGKLAASLVTASDGVEVVSFRYGAVVCLEQSAEGKWTVGWMIAPDLLNP
jgi:phosphohistidine phosphatase